MSTILGADSGHFNSLAFLRDPAASPARLATIDGETAYHDRLVARRTADRSRAPHRCHPAVAGRSLGHGRDSVLRATAAL